MRRLWDPQTYQWPNFFSSIYARLVLQQPLFYTLTQIVRYLTEPWLGNKICCAWKWIAVLSILSVTHVLQMYASRGVLLTFGVSPDIWQVCECGFHRVLSRIKYRLCNCFVLIVNRNMNWMFLFDSFVTVIVLRSLANQHWLMFDTFNSIMRRIFP